MNRIDFSHAGGFPLDTDTLQFLQKSYSEPIKALTKLGGDNYIISGVIDDGIKTSDGWVVIDGEIMPFKGDLKQSTIVIVENIQTAHFENGGEREVYFTRYATFGVSLKSIPFASLARMSDLQQQKKCADDLRTDHEAHKEHAVKRTGELQSAHDSLKSRVTGLERNHQFVVGMIMAWSGSINSIPLGWRLCEALKDRFILGAGGNYRVGASGGEATHRLTLEEMPAHNHEFSSPWKISDVDRGSGDSSWSLDDVATYSTTSTGGNQPHNNMPPYYALAYIEYVGY